MHSLNWGSSANISWNMMFKHILGLLSRLWYPDGSWPHPSLGQRLLLGQAELSHSLHRGVHALQEENIQGISRWHDVRNDVDKMCFWSYFQSEANFRVPESKQQMVLPEIEEEEEAEDQHHSKLSLTSLLLGKFEFICIPHIQILHIKHQQIIKKRKNSATR